MVGSPRSEHLHDPTQLLFAWLADAVVVLHGGFVVLVVFGGLLVLWKRKLVWVHVPAAAWGALIEYANLTCPLTPLENALRRRADQAGYEGGFIEHYLAEMIYPSGLTRTAQIVLGTLALCVNAVIYWHVAKRHWRHVDTRNWPEK